MNTKVRKLLPIMVALKFISCRRNWIFFILFWLFVLYWHKMELLYCLELDSKSIKISLHFYRNIFNLKNRICPPNLNIHPTKIHCIQFTVFLDCVLNIRHFNRQFHCVTWAITLIKWHNCKNKRSNKIKIVVRFYLLKLHN